MLAHPREVGGGDRDGDDRVRKHEDQPRVLEGSQRGLARGAGRHSGLDDRGDLREQDHAEDPGRGLSGAGQTDAAPAEVRTVAQSGPTPEQQQDERLRRDPERGGAAEQRDHARGPARRIPVQRVAAEHDEEHDQTDDRDDVVERRRPGERAEHPAGVEHLTDEAVERVEQDLRQAPVGERGGEGQGVPVEPALARLRIEPHEPRRGQGRRGGDDDEDDRSERHDLVDERGAAVIVDARPHDLRNEHRTEQTARDERVDAVGDLRRQREGVGRLADHADRGGQHGRIHESEDARDDRA